MWWYHELDNSLSFIKDKNTKNLFFYIWYHQQYTIQSFDWKYCTSKKMDSPVTQKRI